MAKAAAKTDGRKLRGDGNRARLVEAMLELIGEGVVHPSADAVASRAGVGLRTVFRHFNDMENLYAELSARMRAQIAPLIAEPLEGQDWRERLDRMLDRRAQIYERLTPYKVADDAHRAGSKILQSQHAQMVATQRKILNAILPADFRGAPGADAIDLAASFEAWLRLRRDQGLSVKRARAVVGALVAGVAGSAHANGKRAANHNDPPNNSKQAVA
jgi:AcrR family transcriptional regulator